MIDPLFGEKGGKGGRQKSMANTANVSRAGCLAALKEGKGWAVNRAGNHPSFLIRSFLYGKPNRKYFIEYVAYLDLR